MLTEDDRTDPCACNTGVFLENCNTMELRLHLLLRN